MTKEGHAACLFFFIILIIGNISLAIENNESRILSISKRDFLTVLQDIIFSSDFENINESTSTQKHEFTVDINSKSTKNSKTRRMKAEVHKNNLKDMINKIEKRKVNSRYYSYNQNDDDEDDKEDDDLFNGRNVKKDSFFFLQRNLELRKEEQLFEENYQKNNNRKKKFHEDHCESEKKVNIDDNDKYYYDSYNY